MEVKQALGVLQQAINIAVGNGAYKSSVDMSVIYQALTVISTELEVKDIAKEASVEEVETTPKSTAKKKK